MVTTIDTGLTVTEENRRNLAPNAAFPDTTGWSGTAGGGGSTTITTAATAGAPGGWTRYLRAAVSTAGTWFRAISDAVSVKAGASYTASGYFRSAPTDSDSRIILLWLDSSDATISESVSPTFATSTSFVRTSFTAVAPAGAVSVRVQFGQNAGAASDFLDIGGPLLEETIEVRPWFSGSSAATGGYTYAYDGLASVEFLTSPVWVVPELVNGYEADREVRNRVHTVLNRSNPDVTLREPGLRTGEFRCLFTSQDAALDAYAVLSVPQVFTISDPDVPAIDMLFVVGPENESLTIGQDETRTLWWVTVPFVEVTA